MTQALYPAGTRVALHPALDLWMRGIRFATIRAVNRTRQGETVYVCESEWLPKFFRVSERNITGEA